MRKRLRSGFLLAMCATIHLPKIPTRPTRNAEAGTRPSRPEGRRRAVPSSDFPVPGLVEPMGFEPTPSWLQTRRSPG